MGGPVLSRLLKCLGVSENRGYPFGGSIRGDSILFGVYKGYPYFGKHPCRRMEGLLRVAVGLWHFESSSFYGLGLQGLGV